MRTEYIIPRICLHCGSGFLARPIDVRYGRSIYCSRACSSAAHRVPPPPPHSCACGCGQVVTPGARYISGHNRRGSRGNNLPTTPAEDRFWQKVDKSSSPYGCWLWMGATFKSGYGEFNPIHGRPAYAHRFSYESANGPIPEGFCVLHQCDVNYPVSDMSYRRCVNPAHLRLGTHIDNAAERDARGRTRAGWAGGEINGNHKLTDAIVAEIRHRHAQDEASSKLLAQEFGVSASLIYLVVKRKVWKHL